MSNFLCEPQMSKRGLYPNVGGGLPSKFILDIMNIISYCDGCTPSKLIADKCKIERDKIRNIIHFLKNKKIIKLKF